MNISEAHAEEIIALLRRIAERLEKIAPPTTDQVARELAEMLNRAFANMPRTADIDEILNNQGNESNTLGNNVWESTKKLSVVVEFLKRLTF